MDTLQQVENLIGSGHNDTLRGNARANSFWGQNGSDALLGGLGADLLYGGLGADTLTGGAGADGFVGDLGRDVLRSNLDTTQDVFVFNATAESTVGLSHDVIAGYEAGIDLIDLSAIDADINLAGHQDLVFTGTTPTSHAVWYRLRGADLVVRADVNGDGLADFEVLIKVAGALTADDFLLVDPI